MDPLQHHRLRAGCRRAAVSRLGRTAARRSRSPRSMRRGRNSATAFPTLLPDGEHFLYAALPGKNGKFDIFAGSLARQRRETFVASLEAAPVFAEPGWLLYARQGVLAALPFDARALTDHRRSRASSTTSPSSILDPTTSWTAGWSVSVSASGSLGYYSAPSLNTIATWYDATGAPTGDAQPPAGPLRVDHASRRMARAVCWCDRRRRPSRACGSSIWRAAARHRSPQDEGATTRRSGRRTARVSSGPAIATASRICS